MKLFQTRGSLAKHMKLWHPDKIDHSGPRNRLKNPKIMCVVCNRLFLAENSNEELNLHQEQEHPDFYRDKQLFLKEKFKDRTCPICNKRCQTPGDLKTHMFMHSADGQRKYVCEICGKSINDTNTFKRHMMIHNNEFVCRCKICDRGFRRYDKMMDHCSRVHKEYYEALKNVETLEGRSTGPGSGIKRKKTSDNNSDFVAQYF